MFSAGAGIVGRRDNHQVKAAVVGGGNASGRHQNRRLLVQDPLILGVLIKVKDNGLAQCSCLHQSKVCLVKGKNGCN